MSTYVIGDIQGCHRTLMRLLEHIGYNGQTDELWLTGDLINRGPANAAVLDFAMADDHVHAILGNHELHFLAIAKGGGRQKRKDTLEDLLSSPRCDDYVEWLKGRPLIHHNPEQQVTMVHAGIPPNWSLRDALDRAAELSAVLQDRVTGETFLANLYSNEPALWQDNFTGIQRWQVMANYLTRLRFCTPEGRLELTSKTGEAPPGHFPWFTLGGPAQQETRIVFGHWAALGGVDSHNVTGIDTGCVWGRHLTAWRMDDNTRFQVEAEDRL